jgi:hypothetical protein
MLRPWSNVGSSRFMLALHLWDTRLPAGSDSVLWSCSGSLAARCIAHMFDSCWAESCKDGFLLDLCWFASYF